MDVGAAARVLELSPGRRDRDAVVGAWRRFARAHHPDRCPGDPGAAGRFAAGRQAFETLLAHATQPATAWPAGTYGRAGVLRDHEARRAVPYELRPLPRAEWRA